MKLSRIIALVSAVVLTGGALAGCTIPVGPTPTPSASTPTPTPSAIPSSTPTPVAGFPDGSNTGVPAGTVLTAYTGSCTIQTDGFVIDSKIVTCGEIRVFAKNVVIRNSLIKGDVYSESDTKACATSAPSDVCSFTITDSTVQVGPNSGTGIGNTNFTATRVQVSGGNRSINCDLNCTVIDSYVADQFTDHTGVYHESGIRMGQKTTLTHNTIICSPPDVSPDAGCSAALSGYGDFFVIQNNTMTNNYFAVLHSGFCIYGGSVPSKPYPKADHIVFTGNVFQRNTGAGQSGTCGSYGPVTNFDSSAPGNVWANNTWTDGSPVAPAN